MGLVEGILYNDKICYNPAEFAMDRNRGTWKMLISWRFKDKVFSYGEIKKAFYI